MEGNGSVQAAAGTRRARFFPAMTFTRKLSVGKRGAGTASFG